MAPRRARKDPSREGDGIRKGRGLAKKTKKWGKEKLHILFNEYGQPCGGEHTKLASQLGFFVKNGENFPLNKEWHQMSKTVLNNVWKDVQENTNAPPEYEKIFITALNNQWRNWKCSVKERYNDYKTDEERLANCPPCVVADQWADLISQWNTPESKEVAEINKINRSKQECLNRTGRKSHAQLRKEMEDENKPIDRASVFIATRTDKEGKTMDLTTSRMIETLTDAIEELPEDEQNSPSKREEIFTNIIGKDGHGRMRCMGQGLSKSKVFGKATTYETVAAVRAEFQEELKTQKQSMEAEISRRVADEVAIHMEAFKCSFMKQLQGNTSINFRPMEEQNWNDLRSAREREENGAAKNVGEL